jgi:predicted glutamine amidotransferase
MGENSFLEEKDREEFLKMLEAGGKNNSDAWGYFTKSFKEKHSGNNISQNLKINFKKDWFIIGHNRLSTGGDPKDNKNNHPFWNDRFIMVHNGKITNANDLIKKYNLDIQGIQTDSFVILKLMEFFESENIKQTLNKVLMLLDGSYSVLLYDIRKDELYYFKDSGTSFTIELIGDNTIVASTNKRRVRNFGSDKQWNFFNIFAVPHYKGDLNTYHLYKIERDSITDLGKLSHRKRKSYPCKYKYEKYYPVKYSNKRLDDKLYQKLDDIKFDDKKFDDNINNYRVLKDKFNMTEKEIKKLVSNLKLIDECPLYDNCKLSLEKCPLYKKSIELDLAYFCPKEWGSFSTRR